MISMNTVSDNNISQGEQIIKNWNKNMKKKLKKKKYFSLNLTRSLKWFRMSCCSLKKKPHGMRYILIEMDTPCNYDSYLFMQISEYGKCECNI